MEPRVSPEFGGGGAIVGVYLHATHYDVSRTERDVVWNDEVTGSNFCVEFFVIRASVWKLAAEKSK